MKKIIISEYPWQTRIAITREGQLQNIYFASHATQTLERSFFKGVVTKVLPGIQTAFVDIGQERAGFLHISEIDRELAITRISEFEQEEEGDDAPEVVTRPSKHNLDISKILSEGSHILVQVSKEPVHEKGAKLTTCFTLPGRFIVLMTNIPRIGISKKIEDREERARLKEIVSKNLPEGMGAIIRTTSEGRQEKEIAQDIQFLVDAWNGILERFAAAKPKEKVHEDIDISLQMVRDYLDDDVEAVITNNKENQQRIYKFIKQIAPEHSHKVKLFEEPPGLFDHYGIEKQIEEALQKKVTLKSGGSIVVESTESMTVIDVNTGKYTGRSNLEETILKTNLEAAEEVVRQLRLRNIGGLIVIDFIDMATQANRQKLFKFFEKTLRERDKFQSVVLKISEFGLVEMTRKRSGKTLLNQLMHPCENCRGFGMIKSLQTDCYALLQKFKNEFKARKAGEAITMHVNPALFHYMTNIEYNAILYLEKVLNCAITLVSDSTVAVNSYQIDRK
jgi:ribonuclease G